VLLDPAYKAGLAQHLPVNCRPDISGWFHEDKKSFGLAAETENW
jgi:hypothetical protein